MENSLRIVEQDYVEDQLMKIGLNVLQVKIWNCFNIS